MAHEHVAVFDAAHVRRAHLDILIVQQWDLQHDANVNEINAFVLGIKIIIW